MVIRLHCRFGFEEHFVFVFWSLLAFLLALRLEKNTPLPLALDRWFTIVEEMNAKSSLKNIHGLGARYKPFRSLDTVYATM